MSSDVEVDEEDGKPSPILYLWLCIPVALLIIFIATYKYYHRKRKETIIPTRFPFVENLPGAYHYEFDGNVVNLECGISEV
ncbi:hypothetical protein CAEBREN_31523 [Caenorhabditis brenneri]|uniref:Uncharacterized protein n=1 Tax=Caenorhabditis brenneri TaxID=135651 RepID=G0P0A9_CAEBE|nr:hypothetical protein CAEBREN_31523 [Caenorhabditis brenneri]